MMSDIEQVKTEEPKIKNPKRVAAGKKGAEARKLKQMQVTEVTKPESTTPEKPEEKKMNTHYLPACVVILGIAALYMYRNKPVQQVNEPVQNVNEPIETGSKQEQYDPFEF